LDKYSIITGFGMIGKVFSPKWELVSQGRFFPIFSNKPYGLTKAYFCSWLDCAPFFLVLIKPIPPTTRVPKRVEGSGTETGVVVPGRPPVAEAGAEKEATTAIAAAATNKVFFNMI
jgi:hypothetical protein